MRHPALRILALVLAIGVLVFVVSRGSRQRTPAPLPSAGATAPALGASEPSNRYGVIGPATKNDPHTVRRAVESLGSPEPSDSSPASPPGKP
jgi:hypothetical protein